MRHKQFSELTQAQAKGIVAGKQKTKMMRIMFMTLVAGLLIAIAKPAFSLELSMEEQGSSTPSCKHCSKGAGAEYAPIEEALSPHAIYGN